MTHRNLVVAVGIMVAVAGCGDGTDDQAPASTPGAAAAVTPPLPATPTVPGAETAPPEATASPAQPAATQTPVRTVRPRDLDLAFAVRQYLTRIGEHDVPALCMGFRRLGPPVCHGNGRQPPTELPELMQAALMQPPRIIRNGQYATAAVRFVAVDARGERTLQEEQLFLRRRGGTWAVSRPSPIFFRMLGFESSPVGG